MLPEPSWLSPSVHPVYARLLCAELRRRGFSETEALAGTQLDWLALHHDNGYLSPVQINSLIIHAVTLSGCPWLGLEVGNHTDVTAHGAAGYAAISAADVGSALAVIARYSSLRQGLATFRVETSGSPALVLEESMIDPDTRSYLLCHFAGAILRLLETLTGQPPSERVILDWPMPRPA